MNRSFYYLLINQLNDIDLNIITSIINRLDSGKERVRIQDIATENYVSPAYVIRLCKKLGFNGFSELVYTLAQDTVRSGADSDYGLQQLLDNYDEGAVDAFVFLLMEHSSNKIYIVGEGFADIVADYFAQRLAIYGFRAFNRVHLYDHVMLTERFPHREQMKIEPSVFIALSQSGETTSVLEDVKTAKDKGFQIVAFTRNEHSSLASLSDITFVVDNSAQSLLSVVPNLFFGKTILALESLLAVYLEKEMNEGEA